jgi:UDP-glucose 4-epimerase
MRVAVTGAAGLLGRATVPVLRGCGHEVVALGRDPARLREALGPGDSCRATSYDEGDLAQAMAGCGAVVHLAARRVAPTGAGAGAFAGPNLGLTRRVLGAAARAAVEVVVLASSISVYSPANALPYSEDQEAVPAGDYGRSKLAAERLGREWAAGTGRRVLALRLASLVGKDDGTGADRMLAVFLDRAQSGRPLALWGQGSGARDLLYSRDAAAAIAAALAPAAPGGVINIGSGRPHTYREIAVTINEVYRNPAGITFDPTRAEDPTVAYMDCRRAEEHLGWVPRWTLRSALEEIREGGLPRGPAGPG